MSTLRISRWNSRAIFAGILFFGLLAMTARPATDPDIWWHLRAGQWIVENGRVPHTDPFSFTRSGESWVSHEWLSEVVFYSLWKLAGPVALIVLSSLVTTAGFLFLYSRCPEEPYWAAAATVLGAWASAPCWGARPQMFTFLLASLFLWLLDRAENQPRLLLWIPPLFVLWLNLHAGFALGPALMLLYAMGLIFEAVIGTTTWSEVRPIVTRVTLATLACIALVPLNPSGTHLYRYPFDTLRMNQLRSFIVEWLSPDFHRALYTPFLLLILLLFVLLAWSNSSLKGRVLIPLIFLLFAALDAVRHIPIFVLVAVPVISGALPPAFKSAATKSPHRLQGRFRPFARTAVLILLAGFSLVRWTMLACTQATSEATQFPQAAVVFLQKSRQPERLFAYYDWGGYALWKLYPQYRVFADGRSDLYGDDLLKQCDMADQLQNGWRAVLDDWDVETVLIPPNLALAQGLFLDSQWHSPYHDSQAVIFVRVRSNPSPVGVTYGTIVKTTFQ